VHRISTGRKLWTAEAGFCVPLTGPASDAPRSAGPDGAYAAATSVSSGIKDLTGNRPTARIVAPDPNTHLLWPRTLLPTLCGTLEPGIRNLVTLVYADTAAVDPAAFADAPTPAQLEALGVPYDSFYDPE
jgi:hypothetical protein